MAKKQPGVMLYFDIRPSLRRLGLDEKGRLFEAILEYGEFGTEPDFTGTLGVAWDFIQPRLDRDKERYLDIARKRSAAANSRWENERMQTDASNASATAGMQMMPSSPSNTSTSSTPSPQAIDIGSGKGGAGGEPEPTDESSDFEALRRRAQRSIATPELLKKFKEDVYS